MNRMRLLLANLFFHRRMNLAVALGVATATAVLTGALLVGDSVRGSLRALVLDRLGDIDSVMVTDRFFDGPRFYVSHDDETGRVVKSKMAAEDRSKFWARSARMLLSGTIQSDAQGSLRRASNITVLSTDMSWIVGLDPHYRLVDLQPDQIVLNRRLADEVSASVGDQIFLKIGRASEIPADSPLGRKSETVRTRRLSVSAIIPNEDLGKIGLRPNQQLPLNGYVHIETLQKMLDQPGKVNAVFAFTNDDQHRHWMNNNPEYSSSKESRFTLDDYGLSVQQITRGETAPEYVHLTCNRMLLEEAAETAAARAWSDVPRQSAITYLANSIAAGEKSIPYSTVTGINSTAELGPLFDENGKPILLADDEIVLNSWTAEDLGVEPGASIDITYFEPDTTHGKVQERTETFRLKAVVPLAAAGEPPLPANDPDLTPELPGVTDQASIDDWDPPFPYDGKRVRDKDETYWDEHRTTPKAFVSLAAGRRMWASRFGQTTSIRLPIPPGETAESLSDSLLRSTDPADFGFVFRPVRKEALAAASGTTPFDALFLGFSMFLIGAALMLVALLFRLGVERRASELGLLLAVGMRQRRVGRMLAAEGIVVSALGGLIGVAAGIGYAWLMLAGLRTLWVDAVSTPFLQFHWTDQTTWRLLAGYGLGVGVSVLTVVWTLWRMGHLPVRELLAGRCTEAADLLGARSRWGRVIAIVCAVLALALFPVAFTQRGEAQAGAFMGSGFFVLIAALAWLRMRLREGGNPAANKRLDLPRLIVRNAARNPGRSTLTIGLVAAASFLIIALSAFRLQESDEGSGGFDIYAESATPIYQDFATEDGQFDLGIGGRKAKTLAGIRSLLFRVKAGDDASCLNLYQPTRPRMLGAPAAIAEHDGFQFAATDNAENPWRALTPTDAESSSVPVILDQNTAIYSMHLTGGIGEEFSIEDDNGREISLRVVGLLKNSIFQGDLLLSEASLLRLYPEMSGYRLFLVASSEMAATDDVAAVLEDSLSDFGFDATPSANRLAGFFAVQNTYLSTFQSLGGLGLLLGTLGLVTVQLRNVLERRGELALLRATGFRRSRLAAMVMGENALLLAGGLAVGTLAALVAVLPHWLSGGAAVPWLSLAATLLFVLAVGMLAGQLAVRATVRAPILESLREE